MPNLPVMPGCGKLSNFWTDELVPVLSFVHLVSAKTFCFRLAIGYHTIFVRNSQGLVAPVNVFNG